MTTATSPAPVTHLLYLHGFRSSPQSTKARIVGAWMAAQRPDVVWHCPQLPASPAAALRGLQEATADWPRATMGIVGSSLGGFYATHLAERFGARAVLINPAIHPYDDLAAYLGAQVNLYSGESFEVVEEHFAELRALAVARIMRPERYFLLVRTGDEVLDWREAVAFYAGAWQYVAGGGDHGWVDFDGEVASVLRFAGVPA
jgi:uncharacterized protein